MMRTARELMTRMIFNRSVVAECVVVATILILVGLWVHNLYTWTEPNLFLPA
jgi:hypothetical protein